MARQLEPQPARTRHRRVMEQQPAVRRGLKRAGCNCALQAGWEGLAKRRGWYAAKTSFDKFLSVNLSFMKVKEYWLNVSPDLTKVGLQTQMLIDNLSEIFKSQLLAFLLSTITTW